MHACKSRITTLFICYTGFCVDHIAGKPSLRHGESDLAWVPSTGDGDILLPMAEYRLHKQVYPRASQSLTLRLVNCYGKCQAYEISLGTIGMGKPGC